MREAMLELNAKNGREDLLLKIGMHEGPCIAVTMNERQDYFGQTVNIASRVQGLANSQAIFATGSVIDDSKTADLVAAPVRCCRNRTMSRSKASSARCWSTPFPEQTGRCRTGVGARDGSAGQAGLILDRRQSRIGIRGFRGHRLDQQRSQARARPASRLRCRRRRCRPRPGARSLRHRRGGPAGCARRGAAAGCGVRRHCRCRSCRSG